MAGGGDQAYSTLEALPLHREEKPLPTGLGKQVALDEGKQIALDDGKQFAVDRVGIEVAANDFKAQYVVGHHVRFRRPSRRKLILFAGAVSLVIIVAAVLGGVFGSRHKNSGTPSSINLSNSSAPSPSAGPPQRNIAALSYFFNSVNNTRVYFQDDVGQIIEAANSADSTTWSINRTGIRGKNGSAVAAAVSRPGFPLVISVFYLDANNLIHETSFDPSTGKWNSGVLSDQGYTTMPNSSLAAMYNQCRLCANTTIIAFQDKNGFVQIGNFTSGGWALTQLGSALHPEIGTGLALQPFYRGGSEDQINLYHQRSDLNLSLASWTPGFMNGDTIEGWVLNAQVYNTIPSGSPIAAASSYSNVSTGYETWIEVLSIFNKGIEVNTWSGAINDWLEQYTHPSVMANSTSDKKIYEDLAVTATGNAFSVVKQDGQADAVEHWLVADDMVNWSLVGNLDLGGLWG